ncbi:hypothetical protein MKD41_09940 [Lutibacter sp. A64]|uniref:hypothetical protein n=1 Tax=Lutibacter sp. A64 TaxID=2918526 RepID=UPI001F059E98|nr:hypothetical protein [Lutibacter sp. A64]UMB52655.1 hypothetical protein MKD41_09940 [Lutibacter sp. A64]
MEPYKFEEDIKNKLEKRTIKPTASSWNKLDASLNSKERKKGVKAWYFLAVAVCVVGVLLMVSIFFKDDVNNTTPTIVTIPVSETEEDSGTVVVDNNVKILDTLQNNNSLENSESLIVDTLKDKKIKSGMQQNEVLVDSKKIKLQNIEEIAVVVTVEEEKIEALISEIEDLKSKNHTFNTTVTDSDIDQLLKEAQLAIEFEKLYKENTKIVDAYKLLQDVEDDIDRSTRVKFLETLRLNYENLKTMIAQRND